MGINDYKFVIAKAPYGDVYDYCYKDLEGLDNVDLLQGYIKFKNRLEEKIYYKHFTKKINLPFKGIWNPCYYRNKFKKSDNIIFILYSVKLDIYKYGAIKYLKRKYKNCKIVLFLNDLVSKNFKEKNIKEVISDFDYIYSYDFEDCKKYGFNYHPLVYSAPKNEEENKEEIDIYFCGKAKNRLTLIMNAFNKFESLGFNCKFILSGVNKENRVANKNIEYIDSFMSYKDNIKYIKKSKCLLDIIQENSTGYTLRICEAVAYNKKIITNNEYITGESFYDKSMFKVIKNVRDIDQSFLYELNVNKIDKNYFSPKKLLENVVKKIEKGK